MKKFLIVGLLPLLLYAVTPDVNGRFFGDGDKSIYTLLKVFDDATAYFYRDGATVYIAVVMHPINDNIFGDKSLDRIYLDNAEWDNHNAKHLIQSDNIELELKTDCNDEYSWFHDYAYLDNGTYKSDHLGPDGSNTPPPDYVGSSSFVWNMESSKWDYTLGGDRTDNKEWKSPDNGSNNVFTMGYLDGWYNVYNWEWAMVYEMSFTIPIECDFTLNINDMHNSPERDFPLPVELSSFTVENLNGNVVLNWTTESEIENQGFLIERRKLGDDWQEIASYLTNADLQGQGTVTYSTNYVYVDKLVQVGRTYEYRLADVDYNSVVEYHSVRTVTIKEIDLSVTPDKFAVKPAYPNPFNPSTNIEYTIPKDGRVNITIYDLTGHRVSSLVNKEQAAGWHKVRWSGNDDNGTQMPAGIYLVTVNTGNSIKTMKLVFVK